MCPLTYLLPCRCDKHPEYRQPRLSSRSLNPTLISTVRRSTGNDSTRRITATICPTAAQFLPGAHARTTSLHALQRRRSWSAPLFCHESVKTVEESGRIRGYDAHKCVKDCMRHLLV